MASHPRWGLGPVFAYEWLTRSRRWQAYALRCLFVLALLVGLGLVFRSARMSSNLTTRQQLVQVGESFFFTLTITQLALVLLAAPASTAGAICLDKARGTLAHVMVTDLSDAELVLGKLGARLVPVLNLVACALPVAALGTLLGGIDPMALTSALLIAAGLAVLGCSMALALSVWLSKAHEVMTAIYVIWSLWMLALPTYQIAKNGPMAPFWLQVSNPFWLSLAPYNYPMATSMVEPIVFLLACLVVSAGLAGLSVARVRAVYLRQSGQRPSSPAGSRLAEWYRRQVRWWPGPSLDRNPVLWREWHRNRPSRVMRIAWGLYIAISSLFSLKVIWDLWMTANGPGREVASILNGFQVVIGFLLLGASAGTILGEERVRGSLDVLLSTPMSTRSIVLGKWWGAVRRVPWLAVWPGLITLSCIKPDLPPWKVTLAYLIPVLVLAQGMAIAGLGLALATWITRPGRAATWTVTTLVASIVGWPMLTILLWGNRGTDAGQLYMLYGSPFFNIGMTTSIIEMNRGFSPDRDQAVLLATILWTIIAGAIAVGLFLATLFTFDRCMGRTPERPRMAPTPGLEESRRIGQATEPLTWREPESPGRQGSGVASPALPPR